MGFFKGLFKPNNNNNKYVSYSTELRKHCELDDKYDKILNEHFKLMEQIKMNYTIVMNMGDEFSPQMDRVIEDCKRDISLAKYIYTYYVEYAKTNNESLEYAIPIYDSFKRLAIIYEKRKEYKKAINVCKYAISIGFYKDGTDGQIPRSISKTL